MKEALEATFPQLSRVFFHMNAGRDEPGTTTPLAENSLHLDLCTYIRWIYGIAVRSNASEDRAQRGD